MGKIAEEVKKDPTKFIVEWSILVILLTLLAIWLYAEFGPPSRFFSSLGQTRFVQVSQPAVVEYHPFPEDRFVVSSTDVDVILTSGLYKIVVTRQDGVPFAALSTRSWPVGTAVRLISVSYHQSIAQKAHFFWITNAE